MIEAEPGEAFKLVAGGPDLVAEPEERSFVRESLDFTRPERGIQPGFVLFNGLAGLPLELPLPGGCPQGEQRETREQPEPEEKRGPGHRWMNSHAAVRLPQSSRRRGRGDSLP